MPITSVAFVKRASEAVDNFVEISEKIFETAA